MSPALDSLASIVDILSIIGLVLRHANEYQCLENILTDSEKSAKQIEANLRMFGEL